MAGEQINVQEIVTELKGQFNDLQTMNDERAEAMKKQGVDIEEVKSLQAQAASDIGAKITAMEGIIARMATVAGSDAVDNATVNEFNLQMKSINSLNGRQHADFSAEEVKSYAESFNKFVTRGINALSADEVKQLNSAHDAQGGFLVIPDVDPNIRAKKFDAYGIYDAINKKPSSGRHEVIVDFDDYDESYFNKELFEDSSISYGENFAKVTFNAQVQKYGKKFSRVFLEDAFTNVQSDVLGKMEAGMYRTIAKMVTGGTGNAEPRGILTYANGALFGQIEHITSGTVGKLTWADVISTLPAKLGDAYHASAVYAMQRSAFFSLLGEVDTTGKLQLSNMVNFFSGNGIEMNILGRAVKFDAGMPQVATGAKSLIFGDLEEAYTLIETPTQNIVRDEANPDYIKLWERKRCDGRLVNGEALKILVIK